MIYSVKLWLGECVKKESLKLLTHSSWDALSVIFILSFMFIISWPKINTKDQWKWPHPYLSHMLYGTWGELGCCKDFLSVRIASKWTCLLSTNSAQMLSKWVKLAIFSCKLVYLCIYRGGGYYGRCFGMPPSQCGERLPLWHFLLLLEVYNKQAAFKHFGLLLETRWLPQPLLIFVLYFPGFFHFVEDTGAMN